MWSHRLASGQPTLISGFIARLVKIPLTRIPYHALSRLQGKLNRGFSQSDIVSTKSVRSTESSLIRSKQSLRMKSIEFPSPPCCESLLIQLSILLYLYLYLISIFNIFLAYHYFRPISPRFSCLSNQYRYRGKFLIDNF